MSMTDQDIEESGWNWDGKKWQCSSPGRPPRPPKPERPLEGPIAGVTDGEEVKPGMVGEFLRQNTVVTLTQPTTQYLVSALVLPPGDWEVWAFAEFDINMRGALFGMNPVGAGFTGAMTGRMVLVAPGVFESGTYINSEPARALTKVPTLIPFELLLFDPVWGTGAGVVHFACMARRMR